MTESEHLLEHLTQSQARPVVVVGDVMVDHTTRGRAARLSPEAPIPVLDQVTDHFVGGGAANVAGNIASLSQGVRLVGVVGGDAAATQLTDWLGGMPSLQFHSVEDKLRPTTCKQRLVAGQQQLLRVDRETTVNISGAVEQQLIAAATQAMSDAAVLILSDYAKGVLTPVVCQTLIATAKKHHVTVLVDPKGHDDSKYQGATLVTPNQIEFNAMVQRHGLADQTMAEAAHALMQKHEWQYLLVTMGAQGMRLFSRHQPAQHWHAQAKQVFDVCGAGDTVIATLAAMLARNISLEQAIELANMAAGIVVGMSGTAMIQWNVLIAELMRVQPVNKVMSRAALVTQVQQWRARGETVAFTNGCFDLIHPGHTQLLQTASTYADHLIVGLNSDDSVRRLKGQTRPIQHEQARAAVLAAIQGVAAVTLFDEDTPLELITAIRPDVLIKGGDYVVATVVGAQEVMSWGGRVELIPLVDGHSTTRMVARSKI